MIAAPHPHINRVKAFIGIAGVGVVALILTTWVALSQRGPDLSLRPEMAANAVVLPDGHAITVQRFEVTVQEWNRCAEDGACGLVLRTRPDQDPATTPATGLNFVDVQQYIAWINARSGQDYRLPTAQEWEFMAADVLPHKQDLLFTDPALAWAANYLTEGVTPRALKPQGSFSTSAEGIADLDGSVWEWTMECFDGPEGGTPMERCPAFFVGGEHQAAMSYLVRDPARGGCAVGSPPAHLGLRLVRDEDV